MGTLKSAATRSVSSWRSAGARRIDISSPTHGYHRLDVGLFQQDVAVPAKLLGRIVQGQSVPFHRFWHDFVVLSKLLGQMLQAEATLPHELLRNIRISEKCRLLHRAG